MENIIGKGVNSTFFYYFYSLSYYYFSTGYLFCIKMYSFLFNECTRPRCVSACSKNLR
jgi:hypothetical protein